MLYRFCKIKQMGKVLALLLVTVFLLLGIFFYDRQKTPIPKSPIPKIGEINEQKNQRNLWFPKEKESTSDNQDLAPSAKSAIIVDFDTAQIIYSKNINEKLPVASTIKIMTALMALENSGLSDTFLVSEKAAKVGENSMGLTAGEKLTLQELLYGLLLVSGNDAAVTIAEGVSGNETAFTQSMNKKTKSLGLANTKFINASGLDDDNQTQYSTAYDMAIIAHYVWEKFPDFRQITSTYNQFIPATETHKAFNLYNDTNLLTTYPGVKGIKPGFTWEAGLCLVTYAENDGKKLLAVILGSEDRRGEMVELLDYGFAKYAITVDHPGLDL